MMVLFFFVGSYFYFVAALLHRSEHRIEFYTKEKLQYHTQVHARSTLFLLERICKVNYFIEGNNTHLRLEW